jgi:hypothetical protein
MAQETEGERGVIVQQKDVGEVWQKLVFIADSATDDEGKPLGLLVEYCNTLSFTRDGVYEHIYQALALIRGIPRSEVKIHYPDAVGGPVTKSASSLPAPKGTAADIRIISAIDNLCNQLAICGLEQPISITVRPGQASIIEYIVSQSGLMLYPDKRCDELTIGGIVIREANK